MERLWAPWRLKYVKSTDDARDRCVFCITDEDDEFECKILQKGKHCFVILNIYPYNNGHLMVAPYRHVGDFCSLTPEEKCEIMEMLALWTDIEKEVLCCHGFNIGANIGRVAGAGIEDHVHFHVVPRWNGDVNFMPVIGNVKVIPESLEQSYRTLRDKFEERMHERNKMD